MPDVTVLTPSFNRADYLTVLYQSLLRQTSKDFIWFVVDDGSTDSTEEMVKAWITEERITILYKKKKNGGKHTALNFAYSFIETPLTFIVDSDDYLIPEAIDIIRQKYQLYKEEKDLCGFSFLRARREGGYLSSGGVPVDNMKETFCRCRIKGNIRGDMAEVWFTQCLKEYPFPEFDQEKFLGEDIVWIKMSSKYKMRFYNEAIYISDYLENGLTKKRRQNNIASPRGCVARAEAFLDADVGILAKNKAMLQYIIYGKIAEMNSFSMFKTVKYKTLYLFLYLPAQLCSVYWRKSRKGRA